VYVGVCGWVFVGVGLNVKLICQMTELSHCFKGS